MTLGSWQVFVAGLRDLTNLLGTSGVILLATIVAGSGLLLLYMVLRFGEKGAEMFLPFLHECFSALRRESSKDHPAIRLELRLQMLFGAIMVLCLLASLLHALSPWVREGSEQLIFGGFASSLLVSIGLIIVSVKVSTRL
jgi:hypothetical protein